MKTNTVKEWVEPGLCLWQKHQAAVSFLQLDGVAVPKIFAPALGQEEASGIIISGQHHEEISGPKFCLNPLNFEVYRQSGISFYIYAIVNQFGLNFPEETFECLLRYDWLGRNFNDGFGNTEWNQPTEEALVENDINEILKHKHNRIAFAIAHHEDSENPKVGYIYTHLINENTRVRIRNESKEHSLSLAKLTQDSPPDIVLNGKVEEGFVIADTRDGHSFEEWIAKNHQIPSFVIEAPFGLELEERVRFQKVMFDIALKNLL